jgi:hypothetical protein
MRSLATRFVNLTIYKFQFHYVSLYWVVFITNYNYWGELFVVLTTFATDCDDLHLIKNCTPVLKKDTN